MHSFNYRRPGSLAEALTLLQDEEARPLAGGMTLLPTMKQRMAQPETIVDLAGVPGLSGIERRGDTLTIGAMTCHRAVAESPEVQQFAPALAELAGNIGDPMVRNRGTIGGSIANNDPAADYPAAVMGLNATLIAGTREIEADAFFLSMFETALRPGELLTAIRFPRPYKAGYAKFRNPASRYAIVGVFAADGPTGARVAVTGAGGCVFRWTEAETALADEWSSEVLKNLAHPADELNADIHATADYRAHLIKVMAQRAVASSLQP
jgi:aerobic carbon-monoxide dehydrogenase medium subunit